MMSPSPSQPISSSREPGGRVILLNIPKSIEALCESAATAMSANLLVVRNLDEVREQVKDCLPTFVVAPPTLGCLHVLENQDDTTFRRLAIVFVGKESLVRQLRNAQQAAFSITATTADVQSEFAIGIEQAKYLQWKWDLIEDFQRRLNLLTSEERMVLDDVCLGVLNKQMAKKIGVSIRTIEQRRRRVFEKMEVESAIPLASQQATFHSLRRPLHRKDSPHTASDLIEPNSPALPDVLSRLNSQGKI